MNGTIFLVRPGNTLVELRESEYDSEAVLQTFLADHPTLLPGDQISPDAPRRWLLVTQEMAVPDAEDGGDRWSLDHLFLDQDAIPTLIETKRSSDTRIRREVVGQMLDYAANGVAYWPVERLRNAFQRTCEKQGTTTDEALAKFLGDDADVEGFWQKVGANLKAGRIRMAFVADIIPQELLRVVEFLNEQMDPAEVIAVEIKQFKGADVTTLVPRVLGVTATAQVKKQTAPGTKWTEDRFIEALRTAGQDVCVEVFKELLQWTSSNRLGHNWGKGSIWGSVAPCLRDGGRMHVCVYFNTEAKIQLAFTYIKAVPGFISEDRRVELVHRFNHIPGVRLDESNIGGWVDFPANLLIPAESRSVFFDTLKWYFAEVRSAIASAKSDATP